MGDLIFEAFFDQLHNTNPDGLFFSSPTSDLRVCDFDCNVPTHAFEPNTIPPQLELLFCCSGSMQVFLKSGSQLLLKTHELLLLLDASEIASFQFLQPSFQGILLSIPLPLAGARLGQFLGNARPDAIQVDHLLQTQGSCSVLGNSAWGAAVFSALQELPQEERGYYSALKAAELLYLLSHRPALLSQEPAAFYHDLYQTETVQQVHDYILANYEKHLTIQNLAQRFHLSATTLKSCFRELYGQPIHQYLREYRLQRAAELLRSTSFPVLQIASLVGYESVSQFGIAFKGRYHMPPLQYRRIMQNKKI